ncbi:MAG: sigma-70 family RNA polymerase sigma factor [Angelakisella sp.]|jgi:RNA polymerase sigma factor (sigma-70 family)|nr:sigma-70 family RNA polymerase sigma factor [Angelakisella sp.]
MQFAQSDVTKAKAGDREAFGRLYDAVAKDLYRAALYTLGNPQDAEDIVAETFLEAWKGIHTIREEASFRQWIMRILSIRCKRRIGGYVKEKGNIDIEDYIEEGVPDDTAPRAEVREAMGRLSPEERQIVVLSVLEGYAMREIGEILGLPQGTVSSKLHRTLKKLRRMLEDS